MYLDRFDICAAHLAIEWNWNQGGWLQERPSNQRRREATHVQLYRIGFKPSPLFNGKDSLSENGLEIYNNLCRRYKFNKST
jgi:hypothetical protein